MNRRNGWEPVLEPEPVEVRFKWGLNGQTGELAIWEVAGPGDGFPTHSDYLLNLWGREPRFDAGDVVGSVIGNERSTLTVTAYSASVPQALLEQLRTRFPHSTLVV